MSGGLFFDQAPRSAEGRFFRDLPGREAAEFHKAASASAKPETSAPAGTEAPVANKPNVDSPAEKRREKTATPDPTFLWDEPVADGFHRPAREQPEALESGGERFHASAVNAGTGSGTGSGVVDSAATPSSAIRKHASLRFLGTSFEKSAVGMPTRKDVGEAYDRVRDAGARALDAGKDYGSRVVGRAEHYGRQALDTLKGSTDGLGEKADELLDAASKHPLGAAAMLGGAGVLGAKAVRSAGHGLASLVRRKPPAPKGLIARGLAGLQHLIGK